MLCSYLTSRRYSVLKRAVAPAVSLRDGGVDTSARLPGQVEVAPHPDHRLRDAAVRQPPLHPLVHLLVVDRQQISTVVKTGSVGRSSTAMYS